MNRLLATILLAVITFSATSQVQTPPSREFRSTWLATVWRLDWPLSTISETGNAEQIAKQQQQMTTLLDSLQINNFNAVNFQVRSRSDAMYKSSYEPWSSDLVSERGMDPGWDPLEWVVNECHKRGMECHAWINPYRYESVIGQWDGTPQAYRAEHPDWVMDVGNAAILNPGLPEVTQRICDIISEIITNYDVDGVLFDDYFYLSGTSTEHDGDLYNAYTAAGGTLSIKDWRRSNVNGMIEAVYTTIKRIKPWVRFGVSPAGIACTDANVARSYGIERCPTGSDWQYNDIYSDPIAWISQQNLDFISPQIYWTTEYSSPNYTKATKWWSMVANKWERHLYVSHSISSLTSSSKSPEMSTIEEVISGPQRASGGGSTTFEEYAKEVNDNRTYTLNDAPGSIFYSTKYVYRVAPLFGHHLRKTVFNTPCLPPAMNWMGAPVPQPVKNLSQSGTKLTWDAVDNMRYSIYAYPVSLSDSEKLRLPEYLLGMSYSAEYTIDDAYASGYTFGVCAFDRYGNESSLTIPGTPTGTLETPIPTTPINGEMVEAPFDFEWAAVDNATEYIIEIGKDASFTQRIDQRSTTEVHISSTKFIELPLDVALYWRVRACSPGYIESVSAAIPFTISQLRIESPTNTETTATLTPTFVYTLEGREVTLEISTTEDFAEDDIIYSNTHTGNHKVADYALCGGSHYYARARYMRGEDALVSPIINFYTPYVEPTVPAIAYPVAGGELYSDQHIQLAPIVGPSALRIEVSADESFPVRKMYINTKVSTQTMTDPKSGADIRITSKALVDGQTYYVRARATFLTEDDGGSVNTEYSAPVSFTYRASSSGVDNLQVVVPYTVDSNILTALSQIDELSIYDASGRQMPAPATLSAGQTFVMNFLPGIYVISCKDTENTKIIIH